MSKQNEKLIVRKERKDGTSDIIVTKSPSKTLFGKIVIGTLAFAMLLGGLASLVFVILQAAGVIK